MGRPASPSPPALFTLSKREHGCSCLSLPEPPPRASPGSRPPSPAADLSDAPSFSALLPRLAPRSGPRDTWWRPGLDSLPGLGPYAWSVHHKTSWRERPSSPTAAGRWPLANLATMQWTADQALCCPGPWWCPCRLLSGCRLKVKLGGCGLERRGGASGTGRGPRGAGADSGVPTASCGGSRPWS